MENVIAARAKDAADKASSIDLRSTAVPVDTTDIFLYRFFSADTDDKEDADLTSDISLEKLALTEETVVSIRLIDLDRVALGAEEAKREYRKTLTVVRVAVAKEVAASVRDTDLKNAANPLEEALKVLDANLTAKAKAETKALNE